MERDRIIAALAAHEPDIRARGARALYLFGSVLRGEERPDSDVDLFIDPYRNRHFSLVDLVALKQHLTALLRREVDLHVREGLHRMLRSKIESEATRVF